MLSPFGQDQGTIGHRMCRVAGETAHTAKAREDPVLEHVQAIKLAHEAAVNLRIPAELTETNRPARLKEPIAKVVIWLHPSQGGMLRTAPDVLPF